MKVKATATRHAPRLYRGSVPSVTEVLGVLKQSYFEDWARKIGIQEARRLTREAADFGTAVHVIARDICRGKHTSLTSETVLFAAAIKDFLNTHVDRVLETELELVSEELGFGGTLDLYCKMRDGTYAVVDWKTTAQLTRTHGLQTAGYAILLKEAGHTVHRRLVIRLRKENPGTYYCRHYRDHKGDRRGFEGALALWWWEHGHKIRGETEAS